jgi:NAD(P)-dependent dehydrogenase (short-subunit alcohol dehydrogenase family)
MSDVRFDGQVVLVTGAGRGQGREHAKVLAARGASVVVNDLGGEIQGGGRDAQPADDVVAEIEAAGGSAMASVADVSDREQCEQLIDQTIERFGRLDAIIHNAGICNFTPITEIDDEQWRAVLGVSLDGAFWLSRAAWPQMVRQQAGRILFIGSAAGLYGAAVHVHYGAAKMGLKGLSTSLAIEGGPANIRVNTLAVGAYTRMAEWGLQGAPNLARFWRENYRIELVTPAALWLVHPDCGVTGRIFQVFGSRLAEVVIAETRGLRQLDFSLEEVRDRWSEVTAGDVEVMRDMDHFQEYLRAAMEELGAEPYVPDEHVPPQFAPAGYEGT